MSTLDAPELARAERRWLAAGVVVAAFVLVAQVVGGFVREAVTDEPSVLDLVETCLTERDTRFAPVAGDPIALSAARGALRTSVGGNAVTVALGGSEKDAERVFETYRTVAAEDVVATRLELRRRVVFLWDRQPSAAQRDFMILCTLDAQD